MRLAAVIPIKMTANAKTRLSHVLTAGERTCLVLEMLGHMLGVLEHCKQVAGVYVATSDQAVVQYVEANHPQTICIPDAGGINQSAAAAAQRLKEDKFDSMLYLLGDLPLLTEEDVSRAALLGLKYPVVLMPDCRHSGTNGLLLSPPDVMETHFGSQSFQAHLAAVKQAGLQAFCLSTRGFAYDMDTPEDLKHLALQKQMQQFIN
ncbi:MAG: 2-phospho-L-lactate guanylyltransferase [Oscillospiraceae bacterium]|jgi:2-phospho-L-lactate guanylyltransferase